MINNKNKFLLYKIVEIWNLFIQDKSYFNDEIVDFRRSIHELERIVAMNILRENDKENILNKKDNF